MTAKQRVELFYAALGAVVIAFGFAAGFFTHGLDVQVKTKSVTVAPKTVAALEAAWGKPDQTVDGAQLGLKGATCDLYQSKGALICHQ